MIRLNLLPHRLIQQHFVTTRLRRKIIGCFSVAGVLCLLVTLGLYQALWQQQQRNLYLQTQSATHDASAQEGQALQTQITDHQVQQQQLSDLMAQQHIPWFILTQLETLMPQSLYLTNLIWQTPLLSIEGLANSHEAIALLVSALNQSPWLTNTTLLSSQQQAESWVFVINTEMSPL